MKLLSATVSNYRTHRNTSVKLDDKLVLIHGPNESGKSTLAEAIHCALFLKAKGTTDLHKAMASDHGGTPEVTLQFEVDGRQHSLRKTFGGNGTTVLKSEGQATQSADPAEERLAELLMVDGSVSGGGIEKKMKKRWAHLWVWQGTSCQTPLLTIEESRDQLRDKLQAGSGQTILSSAADNTIIATLQSWEDSNFTRKGNPSAGSDLKKVEEALEAANKQTEGARDTLEALQEAASAFEQAEADVQRHSTNLSNAESQLEQIRCQLQTVNQLRETLKDKSREREDAEQTVQGLSGADAEIRKLERALDSAQQTAAPLQQKLLTLKAVAQDHLVQSEAARQLREDAVQSLRRLRSIADAWQIHRESLQAAQKIKDLNKALKALEKLRKKQNKLNQSLAPLKRFTERSLRALNQTERSAEQAKLRLEAYALQLELLESKQAVTVDGETLESGQARILSQAAELQIGKGTRIRLIPGGAEDLDAARESAATTKGAFVDALEALAVSSTDEAREHLRQRELLTQDLEKLEEQIEDADPDALEADLKDAEHSLAELRSRLEASVHGGQPIQFSDNSAGSDQAHTKAREQLDVAENDYTTKESEETATHRAAKRASETVSGTEETYQEQADAIKELQSQLNYALKKSGDVDTRSQAINQAQTTLDLACAAEQTERTKLDALGAEQLELDEKRLSRSTEKDHEKLKDANDRKIEARTVLRSSGNQDPESELKQAIADADRQQQRFNQLNQQAEVRRHLLEKLRAARQATTAALAKPLEDAVSPYLRLIFGGSRAQLQWSDDGSQLEGFRLDRTDKQQGLHSFEKLSHGTREQVALALRLAMAQLLAADHDNCLPIVLDDAFTNADKERIEKLKNLLFQASQKGLQIILLSCHPENYNGLSASETALARATAVQTTESQTTPVPTDSPPTQADRSAPQHPATTKAQRKAFLDSLESLGGKAGNTTLRLQLGWEENNYETVKSELLASAQIQPGRGRGGSVRLN